MSPRLPDGAAAFALRLADISREMLKARRGDNPAEQKADRSYVTALDRAIEARLREEVAKAFPQHGVWGEEFGRDAPGAEFEWILDPIDGTAPFMAGMPVYSTLIALAHGPKPVLGVMDFPATGDRWIGQAGHPTLRKGVPCRVRDCAGLASAWMTTSSPDFYADDERPALTALQAATQWRIYGGAALSYGLLAAGTTDLACDTRFQVYDFAPYVPIIEGAGGIITDWAGRPLTTASGPQILAAGTPHVHQEALNAITR